jgi:hypothetical protein
MRIDVNTSLGHWPFMRFDQTCGADLARHLAEESIDRALVWSIDSVLFPEPHLCNLDLAEEISGHPSLIPLMTVDPSLSHWRNCLAHYRQMGPLNAVRIVPNYHRYPLDLPVVDELAETLIEQPNPVLVVQLRVDDERGQYPLMMVPGVSVDDVVALAWRWPALPIVCLCPYRADALRLVRETDNVYVDISFVEFLDTLAHVTAEIPAGRLLFGSHTPFLYTRAAGMKLDCATIDRESLDAIAGGTAAALFGLS